MFENIAVSENQSFLSGGGIQVLNIENLSFINTNITNNVAQGL